LGVPSPSSFCWKLPWIVVATEWLFVELPTTRLPYSVVPPPEPDVPTVRVLLAATAVSPLRLMAPVPVAKVLVLEMVVAPLSVTVPRPDRKVPVPVAVM